MNKVEEARLNMCNAVIAFLDANPSVTGTIAAFAPIFGAFVNKIDDQTTAGEISEEVITGASVDKTALKQTLSAETNRIGAAIVSYAASVSNNTLKQAADFSISDLMRMKDEVLSLNAHNVRTLANDNIAALAPWNITAPTVSSFLDLIEDYEAATPTPRNRQATKSANNTLQKQYAKEAMNILTEQIDPIILQFKSTNPEFYAEYLENRVIVDAATIHTQIKGTITSAADNDPIAGVIINAVLDGETETTTTDIDGKYSLKTPDPGIYIVSMIKTGFITKTFEDVEVKLGQATTINTQLNPAP